MKTSKGANIIQRNTSKHLDCGGEIVFYVEENNPQERGYCEKCGADSKNEKIEITI